MVQPVPLALKVLLDHQEHLEPALLWENPVKTALLVYRVQVAQMVNLDLKVPPVPRELVAKERKVRKVQRVEPEERVRKAHLVKTLQDRRVQDQLANQ